MHRLTLLVATLLLCGSTETGFAEPVAVNGVMKSYSLADQFGDMHTLASETRAVLIASERKVSVAINEWLTAQEDGFLEKHKLEYVSDISPMPAPITKLFALPKMQKLKFKIYLNRADGFEEDYPREDGKLALFLLDDDLVITAIHFLETPEEIQPLIQ